MKTPLFLLIYKSTADPALSELRGGSIHFKLPFFPFGWIILPITNHYFPASTSSLLFIPNSLTANLSQDFEF